MRELPHDRRAFFPSALLRNALAPHCCDFGWLISGRQDSQLCHAWETTAFRIFIYNSLAVTITVGLRFGLRLPAFSFTIACGNITVGHFRLQLHVATLQLDYVLDYGFLHFRLQLRVATRLFSVECPGFRGNLSRELLWKTGSGGR